MDRYYRNWQVAIYTIGLGAIALFTFHAISSLVFSAIGLAPSNPQWRLTLTLGGFLAVAGAAAGLHSVTPIPRWLTGLVSGASSLAILCFYGFGQLSGQQSQWAIAGAVIGLIGGGSWGVWTAGHRGVGRAAIALISSLCAYGMVFGLASWSLAAINVQHWGLAMVLGLLMALYLWFTQQALKRAYRQWRQEIITRKESQQRKNNL